MKFWTRLAAAVAGSTLLLTACGGTGGGNDAGKTLNVAIAQFVSHPSLDAAVKGFKEELSASGLTVSFDEKNAQGDSGTASSIATTLASAKPDLVLAVATPMAQAIAQADASTPVLFTAVTDPKSAELVQSNEKPGHNVTGTSDLNPVAEQIALVKQLKPEAKSVGIVYSSGEVNSELQVKLAKEAAQKEGLSVQEATVTNSSEVQQAADSLTVDALYVPTDNIVVSALESVISVAEKRQVPLVVGEPDSVKRGGLATFGLDYEQLGRQTAKMAVKVLKDGVNPADMPVETQKESKLVINGSAAKKMGVTIPESIKSKAESVG